MARHLLVCDSKVLVEWLTRVLPDRTMILRDNSAKLLDGIFDTRL